jgi:imidazolonepropionase-like amidohydrolase
MRKHIAALTCSWIALGACCQLHAQVSSRPVAGMADNSSRYVSLTNATIYAQPNQIVRGGTLVIRDGLVEAVLTANQTPPAGSQIIDVEGKTIRPGFIDLAADYGTDGAQVCGNNTVMPPPPEPGREAPPAPTNSKHWNARICPERDVSKSMALNPALSKTLRRLGITSVLVNPPDGVLRGQSALVNVRKDSESRNALLTSNVAQAAALEQDFSPDATYPGSYMGAIALIRQALLDAQWQQRRTASLRVEANSALDALNPLIAGKQPLLFFANDELDVSRAQRIANEFSLKLIVVGSGTEYRLLNQLDAASLSMVVPLNFPPAPEIEQPEKALDVSLEALEKWRYAPFNPSLLAKQGARFGLTTRGMEKPQESFLPNLRQAVRYGLSESKALAALTIDAATLIGMQAKLGSLAPGKIANFSVADENLFSEDAAKIYEIWVDGEREVISEIARGELAGDWHLEMGLRKPMTLQLSGDSESPKAKIGDLDVAVSVDGDDVLLQMPASLLQQSADKKEYVSVRLHWSKDSWRGAWLSKDGLSQTMLATRTPAKDSDKAKKDDAEPIPALPIAWRYPAGEFGRSALPEQVSNVVFRQATVWMTGADSPLVNTDVLLHDGKIAAVGAALKVPTGSAEIDARGKHLSPGLIDAHSHVAVSGNVNEPTHAVTSEVRIGDVIDPTDINIYRELAGGTTTAQILHGSANPIGGQSQIIKLRWGATAEQLKFAGAMPTIKFALGENPKQANWGDNFRTRYPQTRMGVEQMIRDSFVRAKAYGDALKRDPKNTRQDLRLQALLEILQGQRLVHIHSYRADEILMFARLSQEFAFKIGAFQHVLEGYKVADVIHEVGAGASTFADWWAYKVEVLDAIPQNATLMTQQGVVVSINSDSNDLGRHLNTEAAKSIHFGGLSETAALALVTINPAKQLRIDDRVGSIQVGKQADLVLWNDNPLSSFARAEQVWIDGRKYFDRTDDLRERERIASARFQLIQAALPERVKELADKGDEKATESKKGAPQIAPAFLRAHAWSGKWSALRGIYHNGEAVHQCTSAE